MRVSSQKTGGLEVHKRRRDAEEEAGGRRSMEDENERTDPITVLHRLGGQKEKRKEKKKTPIPNAR
jgi:hypothetical protein